MRADEVVIIGAGIGGLALAAACERTGIPYRVVERAPALHEVGAGLGLWASAIRALRTLGVDTEIWPAASELVTAEVCSWRGKVLARNDFGKYAREFGAPSRVVHRAELHAAIAARVDPSRVHLGASLRSLHAHDTGVEAELTTGEVLHARVLVGADGLHSVVRAHLFGARAPSYAGETCYRGVAEIPPPRLQTIREVQGPAQRGAVCVLGERRVYWWAAMPASEGEHDDPAGRRDFLLARFAGWPFGIVEAIAATRPDAILRNDLYDRPPLPQWSRGRITLLGDAAHPTTPNLGQGACMAIEDAIVLARSLRLHDDPTAAFAAYEAERRARTANIVGLSRRFGDLAQWRHPALVWLRESLVRLTPAAVLDRTIRDQIGYDAGPLPPHP